MPTLRCVTPPPTTGVWFNSKDFLFWHHMVSYAMQLQCNNMIFVFIIIYIYTYYDILYHVNYIVYTIFSHTVDISLVLGTVGER